jgi:release factor glutamine methyltransferase
MTQAVKTWGILDIIKASEQALKEKGIANPRLNAELLLADTLKTGRINLYLGFEKPLKDTDITAYREKIKRRLKHEPLQYILGYSDFFGMRFMVNPSVLVPRQETELLVEKSIEVISKLNNPKILEIGTGSGCIAISIAKHSNCRIDSTDINENALSIAKENAAANSVTGKISFSCKNILTDFNSFQEYDIIVSNPPYIAADEIITLGDEVKEYEPLEALTDKADGLNFYRKIFDLAGRTSKPLNILLEIGDGKKEKIEKLLNEYEFKDYIFHKDLINICRVLHIIKN